MRDFSLGVHWRGAPIGSCIFISAHVLDRLEEDGRATTVLKELHKYVHAMKVKYADVKFEIILGVGANAGLPSAYSSVSGSAVAAQLASRTAATI